MRRSNGLTILALLLACGTAARAGVRFDDCSTGPDGSVTCDTRPTGGTLEDDEAARFGVFDEASPGWNEFQPYEGFDEDFGDNWT
jgi:hypothetical protein